jgi:FAD/FMN-containing dehydrogenase/Fe-S oxidoreductase
VQQHLLSLQNKMEGELKWDQLHQMLYATDASVYKMLPLAVAYPKNEEDLRVLIRFARKHHTSLIPRTAGTSLAGQCVGDGIVVDVSKHFTEILELNVEQQTVRVQPGVNRDALNDYLKPYGLFFGPNTSTSAYCMLGGMVGNNSSGTTSIRYGVSRDQVLKLETLLSDGSKAVFKDLDQDEFLAKIKQQTLEGAIYRYFQDTLSQKEVKQKIEDEFPLASVHRRNTGYAVDALLRQQPFTPEGPLFNLSKLLAGSEGTLAFTTAITLQLAPLPPKNAVILALHFESISKAMQAVVPLMKHRLYTCELMDKTILDCTKNHAGYQEHRHFIQGDPNAILLLELRDEDAQSLEVQLEKLVQTVTEGQLSYAAVPLRGDAIDKANELRHAGLGLLGNLVGDHKAVACIEDTAVPLEHLAEYIDEFQQLMSEFKQEVVYYAHAGAGELHLRPILNLKTPKGVQDFRAITLAVARLVKKYKGSLSGEHGDGIVRSEFIPIVVGEENYQLFKDIKKVFDPTYLFNPGKIVDSLPMDKNLRTEIKKTPSFETAFDFSADQGLLRAAEKCNGAGKCRSTLPSGAMCPSYRATLDEKDSTRGRANVLREVLNGNKAPNAFDNQALKAVFDLCLSCKACATECPSSVDIATYKAEFLFQYQKANGSKLRDQLFAHYNKLNKLAQPFRGIQNLLFRTKGTQKVLTSVLGISTKRRLPKLDRDLYKSLNKNTLTDKIKSVYLYLDEFSNYNETHIGRAAVAVLERLGYEVKLLAPTASGRTYISKGFLTQAKKCADRNVALYAPCITEETPLIGIEPSAIYTFQDEYPKLCSEPDKAKKLAENTLLFESFIAREIENGNIRSTQFHDDTKEIKIHAHCYQKALGKPYHTFQMLNLPKNYSVSLLNTGCCGMAGSFGYEKEHYEVSIKIGEERLFPAVRKAAASTIIAANGTSCRHQIYDGTGRNSQHPIAILHEALLY